MKKYLVGAAALLGVWMVATTPRSAWAQALVGIQLWNGASMETVRTTSLANYVIASTLTARGQTGAQLVERAARFSVVSAPAANSQGSASIAAEAATRHVADCISWAADASAAVAAAAGTLVLRDGATGAGTVIWELRIAHTVAAGAGIQTIAATSVCGLNLVGTTNTAMTAEFNAGVTGEEQSVTLTGFNVQ
jgi:hypothetical protein